MPLTEEQEHEMYEVFSKFAKGGSIGSNELPSACRAGGLNPSEADLVLWKQEVKSGLDLGGFKKFMGRKFDETNDSTEEIVESFRAFDNGGNGTISVTELTHILTTMGEKLSKDEVKMLLDECDVDNGQVDYQQLAVMLYGSSE
jgi:calmodulin